jgi:curved DNA-binding protein CbpA
MYFRDGAIVHADSADDGAGIIFMLMKSGRLTRAQYDTVHNAMMKTGQKPGAVLVRLGYLRPKELLSAFKQYAEQTVLGLFSLPDGRFTFEERALGPEENMPVKLSTAGLIYRGIKGSVSPTHVMAGLPPPDSLLSRFPDSLTPFRSVEVDDAGRRIISFLQVKRTVGEILALPDIDKMELLKTLSALISMNFIETDSLAKAASPVVKSEEERSVDPKVRAMIEDMHARYQQLGFYGVLDIADTASTAAIKKAYYRAAKKFHPDMHFSLADVGLKAKLSDIFSFVYQAYATLSNGRLRREYDASAGGKPAHPRGTQEKARQQFEDGMVCFRDGNHSDAELHFAQAVYYDSKVSRYHYYYGLALAAQRRFKEAERALEKARKIEPDNPACLAELGFIHLSLGFRLRARGFFEKALALSPSNARAAEGLAALEKHEH